MDSKSAFGGLIFFLVEAGLQVSGYTNLPLAVLLWGIAGALALYALVPTLRKLRDVRKRSWLLMLTAAISVIVLVGIASSFLLILYIRWTSQAILSISRFESERPAAGKYFLLNQHLANNGTLKAFGLQYAAIIGVTNQGITGSSMDQKFDTAYLTVNRNPEYFGNRIPPNSTNLLVTLTGPLFDQIMVDDILSGRSTLYIAQVLRYKDDQTPQRQWRYTEVCVWFQKDGIPHLCESGRNRTYTGP